MPVKDFEIYPKRKPLKDFKSGNDGRIHICNSKLCLLCGNGLEESTGVQALRKILTLSR